MSATPAYDALTQAYTRLHHLTHLQSLAQWDQAANMPPSGNEARAAALAEMATLMHRLRADPAVQARMGLADAEGLSPMQRANLREIRRDWLRATALPEDLVQRRELATARCEHAWRTQRQANDWAAYLPNLTAVLAICREEAQLLAQRTGLQPYDALLDQYEPGMTAAKVSQVFTEVRGWLPGLVAQITQAQAAQTVLEPVGPFPQHLQRQLCERLVSLLGFDFEAGRLDVSTHPFSGGVPEDVRLTTRFRDDDLLECIFSTIHETGHGRYEQNLPRDWLGQPLALARSMALHESQSLAFEMQLARHPGFAGLLAPLLVEIFGDQAAFEPGNLYRLFTRVRPSLIRVDADEVTYPAHVILRFDIERALIDGDVEAADIPALWDEGMAALLGLDTRGDFKNGAMQDPHWASGLYGYFPCYSLGAMYAAQWFASIRRALPDMDQRIAAGELQGIFEWLREHIWDAGSRWPTDELSRRASGEVLNPAHFKAHLQARYLGT
jgi:carboxypeptidase Taq